ncbi:uncharacterized protein LOC111715537 [Eurytemora carolleeae]|uniref:uncharacterized protein LOC111715537 n=1 Tax=Eurytemora carolleeae TaxID=1294199 RepID=UPI000C77B81C|nr:uncharacterized protein LOC111715537 [Eurytemora carolleeae]|eukprot:XP_023346649.1 uncharacterized protein LOC111715537 [Eurytemora affinis]
MKADQKDPREDILRTIRILKQNGVARNEIYIRSFEEENLRVLFFDKEQLEYTRKLHKDHSWENPLIVAFDSSGKLFNYPLTGKGPRKHVGVLNFAGVGPGGVCLMEQVSEKSTKVELSLGLTEWSVSVGVKDPIAQIYISDFSWPIINSVFNSLMKTSVEKYLDERFEAMMNQEPPSETTAVYLIDKLHLVPIFLKRARQMAGKEVGDLFCKVVLKILTARSLMAIRKLWVAAMKVFAGEDVSEQNKEDLVEICGRIDLGVVEKSLQNLENVDDCYEVQEFGASALRKKTKSFRYFSKIFEQYVDVCGSDDESRNPYKCKELMNYFLSEYLGLLPFFTLAVFGEDSQLNYPTSTQVELYWRFMKQNVFYKQNVKDVKTADYFGRVQAFNRDTSQIIFYLKLQKNL